MKDNNHFPSLFSFSLIPFALSGLTIAIAGTHSSGTMAQADYGIEEVTVTARKREENLQQTPVSITAIGGDAISDSAIGSITEIESLSPNLNFTVGTGGGSSSVNAFIRGVGEFDFLLTKDPAVGLYIDGVYMARTFGANMELADIERIEVLRGPQGTLFGKNTIGGAINVVTRKPDDTISYSLEVTRGSHGYRAANAYFQLPLSETLSASLSTIVKKSDGWQQRPGGDAGDDDVSAGRLRLAWTPSEFFESQLSIDAVHQRQNSYPNAMLAWNDNAIFALLQNALLEPCCTPTKDIDGSGAASTQLLRDDLDGSGINWINEWALDTVTVKSVTAYREMEALFGRDGDNSALNYAGDVHDQNHRQFSQELQLSSAAFDEKMQWTAGLYYFSETTRDQTRLVTAEGLHGALAALPQPLLFPGEAIAFDLTVDFDNRQQSDSLAAFFHSSYAFDEQWSLTAGARYTQEEKTFEQSATRIASGLPLLLPDISADNPFATPGEACSDLTPDGSYRCTQQWYEFSPSWAWNTSSTRS
ncbi:TonB-dependent receptor [Microbulbifer taiwanensis]|uniref:TonB-dependent receptor n=1 Tax=Microbulbifer taiwanensis TaxID=986746 RepID=UPI00361836FA